MINLHFNQDTVNGWLLNAVLFGFFLLELSIAGYIVYLISFKIPH